jgi:hypothetical protein
VAAFNDESVAGDQSPRLHLPRPLLAALEDGLPALAERTVAAVVAEVPAYTAAVGPQRRQIEDAVRQTITVFVRLVGDGVDPDTSPAQDPALDGAYSLGQGEARAGRSSEMLLAAYRVGARTVWRHWSELAVAHWLARDQLAMFAELIFAYLDRLSATGVSGHADELARTGMARQRTRELLVRRLLGSASVDDLLVSAERADWRAPQTLTAVAVPSGRAVGAMQMIDPRTLELPDDASVGSARSMTLLLVPDVGGTSRDRFVTSFSFPGSVIGPPRPWMAAAESVRRVERTLTMSLDADAVTDTERLLPELVLGADVEALRDLRGQALRPLQGLRPNTRDDLTATLRAWLLHQGRREGIAAELFVHPQTVRYRVGRLRELFGPRLNDPRAILELVVALGLPHLPDSDDTQRLSPR